MVAFVMMAAVPATAQDVIAARAGLLYAIEGDVLVDGNAIELRPAEFPIMDAGSELRTRNGTATVLLNPGTRIEVEPYSVLRMIGNKLEDTRVELLAGIFRVKCVRVLKDNRVSIRLRGEFISIGGKGVCRFEAGTGDFVVTNGRMRVTVGGKTFRLKAGRTVSV